MSAFTQGGWYYESDGDGTPRNHRDKYVVANGGGRICTLEHQLSAGETIANGRLIAAAPDLLAALKQLEEWATEGLSPDQALDHMTMGHDESSCVICEARAAIARAEGSRG